MSDRVSEALHALPVVAILRGLQPSRAAQAATVLVQAGFRVLEVPLNGAGALEAIAEIRKALPGNVVVGAGTVLTRAQAREAHAAGAELLVMPNLDQNVMDEGRNLGCVLMPGVLTPTEAFAARGLGAYALKLFPAEIAGIAGLKALRSVMPKGEARIFPVGGIDPKGLRAWHDAGADGFGAGSSLFSPSLTIEDIGARARSFSAHWREIAGA